MEPLQGERKHVSAGLTGGIEEGRAQLLASTMHSLDWEKFFGTIKTEVEESRRALGKRTQRLAAFQKMLRKQIEENSGKMREIRQLDGQIEEAVRRERCLLRLDASAKKRKAQLEADIKEMEMQLELMNASNQQEKAVGAPASIMTRGSGGAGCVEEGSYDQRSLWKELRLTQSRYQKLSDENKKLRSVLDVMNAEENAMALRRSGNNSRNNCYNRVTLKIALQDLVNTFEAVTRAASETK